MSKFEIDNKHGIILAILAAFLGFSLGQMRQHVKRMSALEKMLILTYHSRNITDVNLTKMNDINNQIDMLQYIENEAVADSLKQSLTHKQDSIARATFELVNKKEQQIQQIAKDNNIKIK